MPSRLLSVQPVLPSKDVRASLALYSSLGFETTLIHDQRPEYAAVCRDGLEFHLQWHDPSEWVEGMDRPVIRFTVDDVDGLHAEFNKAGTVQQITEVWDTNWGTREFHLQDPDRNGLQFYQSRASSD